MKRFILLLLIAVSACSGDIAGPENPALNDNDWISINGSFRIMKEAVTYEQYANFINQQSIRSQITIFGQNYVGFESETLGYKSTACDPEDNYLIANIYDGLRHDSTGKALVIVIPGYENLPVLGVSFHGAYIFADYYGFEIPDSLEWQLAKDEIILHESQLFEWVNHTVYNCYKALEGTEGKSWEASFNGTIVSGTDPLTGEEIKPTGNSFRCVITR